MPRSDDPASRDDTFEARLARADLGAAGRRVAQIMARDPAAALASSAASLASQAQTSDATVIRTVQALGYGGIAELKQALAASLSTASRPSTPADDMRQTLGSLDGAALRSIDAVLGAHDTAVAAIRGAAFRDQLGRLLPLLHAARRIAVFGIGPSAPLARYAAVLLGRAGRDARCLDASGVMLADQMLTLRGGDAVLALTYGRPYREVLGLLGHAEQLSAPFILVTDAMEGALVTRADAVLVVPRGRRGHVALHAGTLLALEIVALALAASQPDQALGQLQLLNRLRSAVLGKSRDV